eukprot:EG_transcript_6430
MITEATEQPPSPEDGGRLSLAYQSLVGLPRLPLSHLVSLDVSHNALVDLSGLRGAEQLQTLVADCNALVDGFELPPLPTLRYLSLAHNQIKSLVPLLQTVQQRCPDLRWISLFGNPACPGLQTSPTPAVYSAYRHCIIAYLPAITFVEGARVTPAERCAAHYQWDGVTSIMGQVVSPITSRGKSHSVSDGDESVGHDSVDMSEVDVVEHIKRLKEALFALTPQKLTFPPSDSERASWEARYASLEEQCSNERAARQRVDEERNQLLALSAELQANWTATRQQLEHERSTILQLQAQVGALQAERDRLLEQLQNTAARMALLQRATIVLQTPSPDVSSSSTTPLYRVLESPQSSPAERYPPAPKPWGGSACAVVQAEELVARARLQSVEATEWHRLAAGRWCDVEAL